MSTGNGTTLAVAGPEGEAWAGSGVEVEGSELPIFSAAAKVRVGVTAVLFVLPLEGTGRAVTAAMQPASPLSSRATVCPFGSCRFTLVVMPLDITRNIAVQWLAGNIACQTLVFLKLTAMYAAASRPVVTGLDSTHLDLA